MNTKKIQLWSFKQIISINQEDYGKTLKMELTFIFICGRFRDFELDHGLSGRMSLQIGDMPSDTGWTAANSIWIPARVFYVFPFSLRRSCRLSNSLYIHFTSASPPVQHGGVTWTLPQGCKTGGWRDHFFSEAAKINSSPWKHVEKISDSLCAVGHLPSLWC